MSDEENKKQSSVIVKLQYPFKWDSDDLVEEVELKRPRGKDIKGLGQNISMNDLFKIAARISEYTPAFYDEMDASDAIKITGVVGDFLDSGQETGKTV